MRKSANKASSDRRTSSSCCPRPSAHWLIWRRLRAIRPLACRATIGLADGFAGALAGAVFDAGADAALPPGPEGDCALSAPDGAHGGLALVDAVAGASEACNGNATAMHPPASRPITSRVIKGAWKAFLPFLRTRKRFSFTAISVYRQKRQYPQPSTTSCNRAPPAVNGACMESYSRIHAACGGGNFACAGTAIRLTAFTLPHHWLYASLIHTPLTSSISTASIGESSPRSFL